ncbi:MAG: glycosyltransferase family 39 protein [Acidobacteriota bacterium]|nr:glycosyltransferase family 39 protein [Acidobacteriota bacterium]
MQHPTLAKRVRLLLLIITCAVYLYGLGRAPLLGPDEPRYAQVAREMFVRSDFVTPTLAGRTWFEKPALLYWLMIAGYTVFGVSEWAARFGVAVAGLLTIFTTGWLARRVEGAAGEAGMRSFGLAVAAGSATCAGLIVFARGASFDVLITATVTLALACFFVSEIETEKGKSGRWLVACYAAMGAALLAKGLIGIVLPVGVIALYYLLQRRRPELFRRGVFWWGPLVTLAVAAMWYAPVTLRHGWIFIDEFFTQHHFARYVSNKYRHPQPIYFYLPVMLLFTLPWTIFLVAALSRARRWSWRGNEAADKLRVFAFAWLVMPVLFFSVSGSKLPGYVLPALPGAALLIGDQLARYIRGEGSDRVMRATGALVFLIGSAGLVFAVTTKQLTVACTLTVGLPAVAVGAFVLIRAGQQRVASTVSIAGVTLLTVVLLVSCALDVVARRESVRDLLRMAEARGYGHVPVVQLHTVERTAQFYAADRLVYDEQTREPIKYEGVFQVVNAARQAGGRILVIVPLEYVTQLTADAALRSEVIGDNGAVALVAVMVP